MAKYNKTENLQRLHYVRALERFLKSIVGYLANSEDLNTQTFNKKVQNALKLLNRVKVVQLYKGELQDLEKIVKKIIAYKDSSEDIENIKSDILYSNNQLQKSKNFKRYKKEKHSKKYLEEWN